MRAGGGFTVQQALTVEAANVIKQAVTLARRRGHAQVTPLHVATTMLSSSTGLLRTACLQSQSHSHPLQCKALELCFNVALNRLPATSSSPLLAAGHPHSHHPSISNALVAAFKRAQAHQRRGSIENQQQPLLTVKIELGQLVISILDDPSVSRVMREAGFSSTQVKTNVEQAVVSLELCSQTPNSQINNKQPSSKENNINSLLISSHNGSNTGKHDSRTTPEQVRSEDVMSVVDNLMNKRRKSLVIVGESVATTEGVVKGVMDKVNKGHVPEDLKQVKFITLPLFSFGNLSRGEVEQKLEDIRCMKSFLEKGLVLYLGDLKWIADYRVDNSGCGSSYYCPVEHMIVELGRLAYGFRESGRFWLMGIGSFQTYMKCRSTGHPSLETAWNLHPLTVPAGGLGLSLITDSESEREYGMKKASREAEKRLTCCADCSAKFESEARKSRNTSPHYGESSTSSSLPSWLKNDNKRLTNSNDQDCVSVNDLCKKWNSFCSSAHKQPEPYNEKTINFSSTILSPSSSASCFSYDHHQYPNFHQKPWQMFEPKQTPWKDNQFWASSTFDKTYDQPSLRMYIPDIGLPLSNPNSTPNSASSSDVMETEYVTKFKEFNAENLKILCTALEMKVPWQKDIIPEIAATILQCRSGMISRKEKRRRIDQAKEETWFFFQGVDSHAKEKVARELAKVVFGSHSNLVTISLSSFSSTRADSTEDLRNKRSRDEQSCSYIERFAEAMSFNPHRVFFVEDVEQADYCSQMGIKRAIESGKMKDNNGDEVGVGDSIIILSCESFSSRSRACSPPTRQKNDGVESEEVISPCVSLDLNMSFEEDDDESAAADDMSIDDIGLLESVDRCIIFKIQDQL